jgi:hypothetical protein
MGIFSSFSQMRRGVRSATIPRVVATLTSGTLGQKTVVVLGLALLFLGVYKVIIQTIVPLVAIVVGSILVWLALKDYERHLVDR